MTWALLAGIILAGYVLYRTFRPKPHSKKVVEGKQDPGESKPHTSSVNDLEEKQENTSDVQKVGRKELLEMIDSVIEQYEEEIREMTPAQQKSKRSSWENIEEFQEMTQIEFSEEVIERFWGFKKGTTPEITTSRKLSLGRGVWYTSRDTESN